MMKDENSEMFLVHCVIHRENLVSNDIIPVLIGLLRSAICINAIKENAKCERLFKQFYEDENADYVRLLLDTEVRWLSNGNCMRRFMDLYDVVSGFLSDKPEMKHLDVDGKAIVSYLSDIITNRIC